MATDELSRVLRDHGYRVTRPRRAVWAVLADAHEHLTVEQIAETLTDRGEDVDLASVYRTLGLLAEIGVARTSRLDDSGAGHWEIAHPDEHFHLVCEECGDVDHHVGSLVSEIHEHLVDGHGFEVRDVELVVTGRCQRCATRRAS